MISNAEYSRHQAYLKTRALPHDDHEDEEPERLVYENHKFEDAHFDHMNLREAKFINCEFHNVFFEECNLIDVDFSGSRFFGNGMNDRTFEKCDCSYATFEDCRFFEIVFNQVNLDYSNLTRARLYGTYMYSISLNGVTFVDMIGGDDTYFVPLQFRAGFNIRIVRTHDQIMINERQFPIDYFVQEHDTEKLAIQISNQYSDIYEDFLKKWKSTIDKIVSENRGSK